MKNYEKLPKDSFGNQLKEGDTIEYFHWCYCAGEKKHLSGKDINAENINRLKKQGYTAEYRFHNIYVGECLDLYKPLRGKIKWNKEYLTYEPLVFSQEDFHGNSAVYVCNDQEGGAYIKKI